MKDRSVVVPAGTFMHINVFAVHRNVAYYAHKMSKRTGKSHDMDDFVPKRWLSSKTTGAPADHVLYTLRVVHSCRLVTGNVRLSAGVLQWWNLLPYWLSYLVNTASSRRPISGRRTASSSACPMTRSRPCTRRLLITPGIQLTRS